MNGPFALIVRRSGSGWERVALYQRRTGGRTARSVSWARERSRLMDDVRSVLL